jgi:enoyl-[acyl-carrier protein] reductase III
MQIKFQTALITGSSRGLGRQIAVKLATEGVKKITIHYRTGRSDAETTLSLIQAAGTSGVLVQGDVADAVVAENLVTEAAQKLGACDIFVQSVCPPPEKIYQHAMATELSLQKWQLAFDTQARAFFIGARTAAKFMRGGGRIIGLSYTQDGKTGGWQPWVGMGPAKAAMDSIGRYCAVALG